MACNPQRMKVLIEAEGLERKSDC